MLVEVPERDRGASGGSHFSRLDLQSARFKRGLTVYASYDNTAVDTSLVTHVSQITQGAVPGEVEVVSDRAASGHVRMILFPSEWFHRLGCHKTALLGLEVSLTVNKALDYTMAHAKPSKKTSSKISSGKEAPIAKDGQLDSPFLHVNTDIRLSIPPVFATDLQRGAMEMLDSLVMR